MVLRNCVAEGIVFTVAKDVTKNINVNDGKQSVEAKGEGCQQD